MRYYSYKDYKDSGFQNLGKIPTHWITKKLKYQGRICNGKDQKEVIDEDGKYPILGTGGVFGMTNSYLHNKPSVLLGRKGTIDKPMYIDKPFWTVDTLFYTNISNNTFPKFFFYSCKNIPFSLYKYGSAVPSMTQEDLGNIHLAFPPFKEQKNIANFLDIETSRIDNLIDKKELFIETLKEKRISIISHAVTKGLNQLTPMKDSGVDWLGLIPNSWNSIRLKFLTIESLKYGANVPAELDDPKLPRYIRITDVDSDGNLRDATFRSVEKEIALPYLLKEGDILFARSGATVGKTFIYKKEWGECAYAGYLIKARINTKKYDPMFIYYYTKSTGYQQWIQSVTIQATIQNVSAEKYSSLWFAIPPSLTEQIDIVSFLNQETKKIDELIHKTELAIDKLKEYRTAIISYVVTGKIKVSE